MSAEQGDVAVIREALNSTPLPRRDPADPGWKHREYALAALDRLAAALERAERERDEREAGAQWQYEMGKGWKERRRFSAK